jgi:enoyl-CoA hydratase
MSDSDMLLYKVENHIAHLTLNRPDKLNAIDEAMHHAVLDAFAEVRNNRDVRVILLSANGRAFSAGGDLDEIKKLQSDRQHRMGMCDIGIRIIETLIDLPVPVVVALHGDAIGLGASIALGCDIIVASKNARLADTHVKVGLVAGDGGCLMWPASMGMNRAKRYLLTGKMLPAEQAYQFGLVTDLVDTPEEVLPAAKTIAEQIANTSPIAIRGTKKALNQLMKARSNETFLIGMSMEQESAASEDLLEAVAAFKEKRKPVFNNR